MASQGPDVALLVQLKQVFVVMVFKMLERYVENPDFLYVRGGKSVINAAVFHNLFVEMGISIRANSVENQV